MPSERDEYIAVIADGDIVWLVDLSRLLFPVSTRSVLADLLVTMCPPTSVAHMLGRVVEFQSWIEQTDLHPKCPGNFIAVNSRKAARRDMNQRCLFVEGNARWERRSHCRRECQRIRNGDVVSSAVAWGTSKAGSDGRCANAELQTITNRVETQHLRREIRRCSFPSPWCREVTK